MIVTSTGGSVSRKGFGGKLLPVSPALTTAGIQAFGNIITRLAGDAAQRMAQPERAERIKTDLTPHIEATYKRCRVIKTLLNPNDPANFLDIYATQRFSVANKVVDQYSLVDRLRDENNNVVITGTGGSGKSMFMRYLWLSMFVNGEGRIPIFIELRALNRRKPKLVDFLYISLSLGKSSITQKDFQKNLERGDFFIILDGFDEILSERREAVQSAILELAEAYPETKIVVSGRPDDRFSSWNSFEVVKVAKLRQKDALELINKAPFDAESKRKFHAKVKEAEFWEKQEEFLTSPLLASMMLLTFSYNYDIPDRMHLFYDQAFDALYQRHDTHKPGGGYKRIFNCDLSEDAFKRLLSYFCLITYYSQKFEFDRASLTDFARKAISIENQSIEPSSFVSDLIDCVCLIVKDGLTYSFAHRSFQEYFTAYCLAYVTRKNFRSIVTKISARANDQAIPLLAEMNPELFREEYLLPCIEDFEEELQIRKRSKSAPKFLRSLGREFRIHWPAPEDRERPFFALFGSSPFNDFVCLIDKLVPDYLDPIKRHAKDVAASKELWSLSNDPKITYMTISGGDERYQFGYVKEVGGKITHHKLDDSGGRFTEAFRKSGMHEYLLEWLRTVSTYARRAERDAGSTTDAMAELFGG